MLQQFKPDQMLNEDYSICIVGLGYVGLPLMVAFAENGFDCYGYDISEKTIESLKKGQDPTGEVGEERLSNENLHFGSDPSVISKTNIVIAAIPTPVDSARVPDLSLVKSATKTIGEHLKKDSIVVFESTVYPGVTEDICIPILEKASGLRFGEDFKVGYSPERINPGDKTHTLGNVVKIVAGSDDETLDTLSELYSTVTTAGIHKAPCIKVAEAAKVIENIQRDVNIALINEFSIVFKKLGIDTVDVLEAAETKWNFHKYRPGLVGGHCIGVDPYYLAYIAEQIGYHPEIILAGRRLNDDMPSIIADYFVRALIKARKSIKESKILVLGLTYKENVPDTRNSKAKELIRELRNYGLDVYAYDPYLTTEVIEKTFKAKAIEEINEKNFYDGFILFSPHKELIDKQADIVNSGTDSCVFLDVKNALKDVLEGDQKVHYLTM